MNRFMNTGAGFALGHTPQAKTKGIWIWIRPHPMHSRQSLVLLDTEGLYDPKKHDKTHDLNLVSLAVLLSSCFIYNVTGILDDIIVNELEYPLIFVFFYIKYIGGSSYKGLTYNKICGNVERI